MKKILFVALVLAVSAASAEKLPEGHPTIQDAIDAAGPSKAPHPPMVHEATALEVLQTDNYTYVEAQSGNEKYWLATQRTEIPKGAHIRFGRGAAMENFYSQTLKREFPSILFVQAIEVVK